jgi:DNA polymerase
MILGEAPGEMEAIEGLPFVGAAGHLLTSILAAAGLSRDEVYIGNILKCRPPSNRDPSVQEAKNCRGFLDLQIKVINPAWIICFGRIPSVYLLGREPYETIGSLRGKVYDFFGKKVICTYHPSYLLRTPEAKGEVWKDLQPLIFALQNRKGS